MRCVPREDRIETGVAALLLTGGASRRMGRDKATLPAADGVPLARRTAGLLAAVAAPVLEVGPGRAGIRAVPDGWPGAGPLTAVASGATRLATLGWSGPVLVVATDLPELDEPLLGWLADHPYPGTVVPVVDGYPQMLCARYDAATVACAPVLAGAGARRMRDLIEGRRVHLAGPDEWGGVSIGGSLRDTDTPEAWAAYVARLPSGGGRGRA